MKAGILKPSSILQQALGKLKRSAILEAQLVSGRERDLVTGYRRPADHDQEQRLCSDEGAHIVSGSTNKILGSLHR